MAWEAAPPFIIICLAVAGIGGLQSLVHKSFYHKPKAIGQDSWDRKMEARDERLFDDAQAAHGTQASLAWLRLTRVWSWIQQRKLLAR